MIPNLHQVTEFLYRSGEPENKEDFAFLRDGYLIKGVINLDNNLEEAKREYDACWAVGIKSVYHPMREICAPSRQRIEEALWWVNRFIEAKQKVLVHCDKGSDRTGMVIAAYRMLEQKWSYEEARKEMYLYGHSRLLFFWDKVLKGFE